MMEEFTWSGEKDRVRYRLRRRYFRFFFFSFFFFRILRENDRLKFQNFATSTIKRENRSVKILIRFSIRIGYLRFD